MTLSNSAASMSACTIVCALAANFAGSPVTRSSNRMPNAKITSAFATARFARFQPCMPSMPRCAGSPGSAQPRPCSVDAIGAPIRAANERKISVAPDQRVPPPTISTGRCARCNAATAASSDCASARGRSRASVRLATSFVRASSSARKTSVGRSTSTGPGRELVARRKAARNAGSICSIERTTMLRFVT